jgi:hypothetical protein
MANDPQPEPISSTRWPGRISALRMICLSHQLPSPGLEVRTRERLLT